MKFIPWKTNLREATWLVILSLALACGAYFLRPAGMPGNATDQGGEADDVLAKAITFEAAAEQYKKGTALFADARPIDAFTAGHIKGALHLDPSEFDEWSDQMFSYAAPDRLIITYCEGPRCRLSHELAEKLAWLGYENVYYLQDGWGLWKKHGLPSATGSPTQGR